MDNTKQSLLFQRPLKSLWLFNQYTNSLVLSNPKVLFMFTEVRFRGLHKAFRGTHLPAYFADILPDTTITALGTPLTN
jgi:hypothetical protein